MAGLSIRKYGETSRRLVFDRSSLTRWRQRMGEDKLNALIQESLAVAPKTGVLKPSELTASVVDTTVQPKNVADPTDAKLLNRARERLVRLARKHGLRLRQSYARVGKRALIKQQRYAHAKQFKPVRTLKTYLRRVMRDIGRSIGDCKLGRDDQAPFLQIKQQFAPVLGASRTILGESVGQCYRRTWRILLREKWLA